ncbi:MAG: hypothetical protein M1819_007104 [Sarea resinae]|nr:MAG: hypothetical protein M1819_007104 [Sarea resinae]
MFLFNKNPSPHPRNTSKESNTYVRPVSRRDSSTSPHRAPMADNYGPHAGRGYADHLKRSSVFGGRSRSNTANSASSSQRSLGSMTSTDVPSGRTSREGRSNSIGGAQRSERSDSMTRNIFARGSKILRRHNSKFSLSSANSNLDGIEEYFDWRPESSMGGRHPPEPKKDEPTSLDEIQEFFDFRPGSAMSGKVPKASKKKSSGKNLDGIAEYFDWGSGAPPAAKPAKLAKADKKKKGKASIEGIEDYFDWNGTGPAPTPKRPERPAKKGKPNVDGIEEYFDWNAAGPAPAPIRLEKPSKEKPNINGIEEYFDWEGAGAAPVPRRLEKPPKKEKSNFNDIEENFDWVGSAPAPAVSVKREPTKKTKETNKPSKKETNVQGIEEYFDFDGVGPTTATRPPPSNSYSKKNPNLDGLEDYFDWTSGSAKLLRSRKDNRASWKRNISEPFGFQHLTHTGAHHFRELDRTSHNELITEFSAIRASQAPRRELQGIRADDLHFKNFSSEDVTPSPLTANPSESETPPRLSPARSHDLLRESMQSPPAEPQKKLRQSRSVENFSRNSPKRNSKLQSGPVIPPPRRSSRAAVTVAYGQTLADQPSPPSTERPASNLSFRDPQPMDPLLSSPPAASEPPEEEPHDAPHAVTTPNDVALHLRAPSFTDLADVPEEEEHYLTKTVSDPNSRSDSVVSTVRHMPASPSNQTFGRPSLDSARLSAVMNQDNRRLSQASDTLGAYYPPPASGAKSASAEKLTAYGRAADDCWEDDIDYCYEHGAEADGEFEWDRKSFDRERNEMEHERKNAPLPPVPGEEENLEKLNDSVYSEKPETKSSLQGIPDLEPRSAQSASTNDTEVVTPSHLLLPPPNPSSFKESDGFTISPSLLIPQDFEAQMIQDRLYDDIYPPGAERNFPVYPPVIDLAESGTDSLHSRTSLNKCNSQESIILSRAASFANGHRSINSASSVPDLVHSRSCKEAFDAVAEQLADQIASINDCQSTTSSHSRSRSSARNSARDSQKSGKKPVSPNGSVEKLQVRMPSRERSKSEAALEILDSPSDLPPVSFRTRSDTTLPHLKPNHRVSYTLFPSPPNTLPPS